MFVRLRLENSDKSSINMSVTTAEIQEDTEDDGIDASLMEMLDSLHNDNFNVLEDADPDSELYQASKLLK